MAVTGLAEWVGAAFATVGSALVRGADTCDPVGDESDSDGSTETAVSECFSELVLLGSWNPEVTGSGALVVLAVEPGIADAFGVSIACPGRGELDPGGASEVDGGGGDGVVVAELSCVVVGVGDVAVSVGVAPLLDAEGVGCDGEEVEGV